MKRLILILLVSTFLVGCGKSRPTYQLMVGTRTVTLVVHEDPKRIQDDLDVPADLIARHTPASAPVAETMARNCRQRWGADYALAIGGFPAVDAAAAEPPAVYFAIAGARGVQTKAIPYAAHPALLRVLCGKHALNMLRLALLVAAEK
jgi:nicotinamide mononucleotide (NMN) deamidase PncC